MNQLPDPFDNLDTLCVGVHESSLILQTALRAAFEDLRAKPYLLKYVFAQLVQDPLLSRDYGKAEQDKAIAWFLNNKIAVFNTGRLNKATFPCVTLKVMSSSEAENTLGDINYDPYEDASPDWPALAGPFDAIAYNPNTGNLTIPVQTLVTAKGQVVVTRRGNQYTVLSAPDDQTLVLNKNIRDDFAGMVIKGSSPAYITSLESAEFQETYMVGCHAPSEPAYASYLHSVVKFSLLMYRQSLLEARNYERVSISSAAEGEREQSIDSGEVVFSRYLQVSGFVRNSWPKTISPKITAVQFQPTFLGAGRAAPGTESTAPWLGDQDTGADVPTAISVQLAKSVVYYGAAAQPGSVDSAFVTSLPAAPASSRVAKLAFNVGVGQYAWYAYPTSFGVAAALDFVDDQTTFMSGWTSMATVSISGVDYYVWRSNQAGLGQYTVEVF